MNESQTQLLQQLADKLGTTTEYLWGVLLRQAPIDAITTLVAICILLGAAIMVTFVTIKNSVDQRDAEGRFVKSAKWNDKEGLQFSCAAAAVSAFLWVFALVGFLAGISDVVNGFVNPEYWALKEVLSYVKK